MDIKKFYNHINICLDTATKLQEDLIPGYQSIKIHSDFAEYFVPYRDHPSYSCKCSYIYFPCTLAVSIDD